MTQVIIIYKCVYGGGGGCHKLELSVFKKGGGGCAIIWEDFAKRKEAKSC